MSVKGLCINSVVEAVKNNLKPDKKGFPADYHTGRWDVKVRHAWISQSPTTSLLISTPLLPPERRQLREGQVLLVRSLELNTASFFAAATERAFPWISRAVPSLIFVAEFHVISLF